MHWNSQDGVGEIGLKALDHSHLAILTRETPSKACELFAIGPDVLLGVPSLIAQLFSGLQMASPLNRVEFSMRGYLGGLPSLW